MALVRSHSRVGRVRQERVPPIGRTSLGAGHRTKGLREEAFSRWEQGKLSLP